MKRGFTLIEMVGAITVGSVLMGAAVVLLCALIRAEGGGREHGQRLESLARLADRFRRDVHAAVDAPARAADGRAAWDLPLAADGISHFIRYEVEGDYITRHESGQDNAPRWDTYALPENGAVSIETEPIGRRRLVRLLIAPKHAAGKIIGVEAVLGSDRRFAAGSDDGE